mmetsp:Transcript_13935/g.44634  ORF Transcript_13935/g.44634 Transcript_13935/m.44634 type:complete len:211 (-) Transcript_13935:137-769(-)
MRLLELQHEKPDFVPLQLPLVLLALFDSVHGRLESVPLSDLLLEPTPIGFGVRAGLEQLGAVLSELVALLEAVLAAPGANRLFQELLLGEPAERGHLVLRQELAQVVNLDRVLFVNALPERLGGELLIVKVEAALVPALAAVDRATDHCVIATRLEQFDLDDGLFRTILDETVEGRRAIHHLGGAAKSKRESAHNRGFARTIGSNHQIQA